MRCAKCGSDNRDGRKFCSKCDVALARHCPRCGASNEPGEDFCGECGAAVTAIAVAAVMAYASESGFKSRACCGSPTEAETAVGHPI
jgi:hypothetical protein